MTGMGHNKPPSLIEIAKTLTASWGMWMGDYPVVLDEVQARESKMELDRAKLLLKDLEDERKSKTAPLLDQVDTIRNEYRQPERTLGNVINEMMERLQAYVRAEEKKREAIAEEAARKARELEEAAREAERLEQERLDDAAKGEVGINVVEITEQADQAFDAYARAEREAIMARKDARVKIGGGFSRAMGMREREILDVVDAIAALTELGVTENIKMAILTSARAFKKIH